MSWFYEHRYFLLQAEGEAAEAEEEAKKLKMDDSEASLMALIQKRNNSRAEQADSFFAQLEAKYAKPQKGKKKKWWQGTVLACKLNTDFNSQDSWITFLF